MLVPTADGEFQSRNRGSFGFKAWVKTTLTLGTRLFQSRNRGSFGFKRSLRLTNIRLSCFINRGSTISAWHGVGISFQSRNRGSFGFKVTMVPPAVLTTSTFQSRNRGSFGFKFNVAIVFSESVTGLFQSRNRGSFGFKSTTNITPQNRVIQFQSRNRGSFGFKFPLPIGCHYLSSVSIS